MKTVIEHYESHLAPVYTWMAGGFDAATGRGKAELEAVCRCPAEGLSAVDLGAGFGLSFVAATLLLLAWFGRRAYLELYSIMCLVSTAAAAGPALGGWARDAVGGFSGVFLICGAAALALFVVMSLTPPPRQAN